MKIKIRYDNQFQTLELNEKEAEQLCVSLSIDPSTADEKKVQEAFDVQFNRPEYNSWRKENRNKEYNPSLKNLNGQAGYYAGGDGEGCSRFSLEMIADDNFEMPDFEYEDLCKLIKTVLKPKQAELVISICLDGVNISEYAKKEGVSQPAITYRLQTAKKNLKKFI